MSAFELWTAAELGLGRPAGLIAALTAEAQRHPTRERLQELVMLALYRAGRQAEALDVYRATRRHLVEELGLEPGPGLRELEERILRHDPSLAAGPAVGLPIPRRRRADAERAPRRPAGAQGAGLVGSLVSAGAIAVLMAGHDGRDSAAVTATLQTPAIGRLDAVDGRRRSAVGLPASPARLATGLGAAWATSYDDGTLLRIDPGRLAVTQTIRVGHGPTGVAVAAGDVWVANTLDNTVTRVDGATSSIRAARPGRHRSHGRRGGRRRGLGREQPIGVRFAGGSADRHGLGTTELRSAPAGLAVGAGRVWVAVSDAGTVARLDARTGRVRQTIHVGDRGPRRSPSAVTGFGLPIASTRPCR